MKIQNRTKIRLLEFFVIGVLFGVIEDLIAISFATDGGFEWRYLWIAFIVALPFAVISELVVDHPAFWKKLLPRHWFSIDEIKNGFQHEFKDSEKRPDNV